MGYRLAFSFLNDDKMQVPDTSTPLLSDSGQHHLPVSPSSLLLEPTSSPMISTFTFNRQGVKRKLGTCEHSSGGTCSRSCCLEASCKRLSLHPASPLPKPLGVKPPCGLTEKVHPNAGVECHHDDDSAMPSDESSDEDDFADEDEEELTALMSISPTPPPTSEALSSTMAHPDDPSLPPTSLYNLHRQSVLSISMCKLNKFRQSPEVSLRRSVLICNTLRLIEQEMVSEGLPLQSDINVPALLPSLQASSEESMTLDTIPCISLPTSLPVQTPPLPCAANSLLPAACTDCVSPSYPAADYQIFNKAPPSPSSERFEPPPASSLPCTTNPSWSAGSNLLEEESTDINLVTNTEGSAFIPAPTSYSFETPVNLSTVLPPISSFSLSRSQSPHPFIFPRVGLSLPPLPSFSGTEEYESSQVAMEYENMCSKNSEQSSTWTAKDDRAEYPCTVSHLSEESSSSEDCKSEVSMEDGDSRNADWGADSNWEEETTFRARFSFPAPSKPSIISLPVSSSPSRSVISESEECEMKHSLESVEGYEEQTRGRTSSGTSTLSDGYPMYLSEDSCGFDGPDTVFDNDNKPSGKYSGVLDQSATSRSSQRGQFASNANGSWSSNGDPNTSPSSSSDSGISTSSDEIFADIDLSLYDFDLLPPLSPPNVARFVTPIAPSAEELLQTLPVNSYTGQGLLVASTHKCAALPCNPVVAGNNPNVLPKLTKVVRSGSQPLEQTGFMD